MNPVVSFLLNNGGVFGILAGVCFWLYLNERKINLGFQESNLQQRVNHTASLVKFTKTVEDFETMLSSIDDNKERNMAACQYDVREMIQTIREYMAREDGRREVTGRFVLPQGGNNEQG